MMTVGSQSYYPSEEILRKYADVLVNFALNSGKGLRKGEVVQCAVPDIATPLALELQNAILRAGGHPLMRLTPSLFSRDFYTLASDDQLTFFPENYMQSKADLLDHTIGIIAEVDPEELRGIDTAKIMKSRAAQYPYREWLFEKERREKFSWTAALWGTPAKAAIVGLSIQQYWEQIIKACYLDKEDPIAEWKSLVKKQTQIQKKLNALKIDTLHVLGEDVDLTVKLGPERAWKTGSGSNIPSFEHFTSPDWRGTNGWIKFNEPLYRYGNIIKGVEIKFKDGLVTKIKAEQGQKVMEDMIASENANKVGEFSLTDKRFSRITHPMAETLFDENIGGPYGNTHLALGMAYKDCYAGDPSVVKDEDWVKMGYNNSPVHTDIVSTTNRTVTATLMDGTTVVIYKDGSFTI